MELQKFEILSKNCVVKEKKFNTSSKEKHLNDDKNGSNLE